MAEKYDNNGYGGGDFKRNSNQDMQQSEDAVQDGEDGPKLNEKAGEYMRDLLGEKIKLNNSKFPISTKLIDAGKKKYLNIGWSSYFDLWRLNHEIIDLPNSVDCISLLDTRIE